jgi:hypothetical protein
MKQQKVRVAQHMSEDSIKHWRLKPNENIIVTKIYFSNGEHYMKGHYENFPEEKVDRPYIFFEDVK